MSSEVDAVGATDELTPKQEYYQYMNEFSTATIPSDNKYGTINSFYYVMMPAMSMNLLSMDTANNPAQLLDDVNTISDDASAVYNDLNDIESQNIDTDPDTGQPTGKISSSLAQSFMDDVKAFSDDLCAIDDAGQNGGAETGSGQNGDLQKYFTDAGLQSNYINIITQAGDNLNAILGSPCISYSGTYTDDNGNTGTTYQQGVSPTLTLGQAIGDGNVAVVQETLTCYNTIHQQTSDYNNDKSNNAQPEFSGFVYDGGSYYGACPDFLDQLINGGAPTGDAGYASSNGVYLTFSSDDVTTHYSGDDNYASYNDSDACNTPYQEGDPQYNSWSKAHRETNGGGMDDLVTNTLPTTITNLNNTLQTDAQLIQSEDQMATNVVTQLNQMSSAMVTNQRNSG